MKKGFTLIELLVVVAIIGILATVVLASLGSAREKASSAAKQQELLQVRNALELYHLDNNGYPGNGCIGKTSGTCFGNRYSGSAALGGVSNYLKLDVFSSTSQLKQDAFVLMKGTTSDGCSGSNQRTGTFILWNPDGKEEPVATDCVAGSFLFCCPTGGCLSTGRYCAYQVE